MKRIEIFWTRVKNWSWFPFFTYVSTLPWIAAAFFKTFSTYWFLAVVGAFLIHLAPVFIVGLTQRPFYLDVDWIPRKDDGVDWRKRGMGQVGMNNGEGELLLFFDVVEGAGTFDVSFGADSPYTVRPSQPPDPIVWDGDHLVLDGEELENHDFYVRVEVLREEELRGGLDHEFYVKDNLSGIELLRIQID